MLGKTTKPHAHTPHVVVRKLKPLSFCDVAHTVLGWYLLADVSVQHIGPTCRETSGKTISLRRVNIAEE
jgi:hypothetical protein